MLDAGALLRSTAGISAMTAVSMLPVSMWLAGQSASVLAAGLLLPAKAELWLACQPAPASTALTAGSKLPAGMRLAGRLCLLLPCSGGRRTSRQSLPAALGPCTSGELPCMVGDRRPSCALRTVVLPPCNCGACCTSAPVQCVAEGHSVSHSWLPGYLVHPLAEKLCAESCQHVELGQMS